MTVSAVLSGFQSLVAFGAPMDDILAIGIFALPLAALGIILLTQATRPIMEKGLLAAIQAH